MNTDLALFVLRIVAGAALLTHGVPKLLNFSGTVKWLRSENFPLPLLSAAGLVGAETLGSLLIIIGAYTQWAALVVAASMTVAVIFHLKKRDSWKETEAAFLYALVFLVIAIAGAGAWKI
jgi:putative oxidoreductase